MQNEIRTKAIQLIKKYGTNNPEEICRRMNIIVRDCDLPDITKGFCITLSRGTAIMINNRLCANERNYCIAHELGHALLHGSLNYMFMSKSTCMVMGKYEREADLFAAYLLLPGTELAEGTTTTELARMTALPEWAIERAAGIE